jgi:curli production assembly/transport component CsgG
MCRYGSVLLLVCAAAVLGGCIGNPIDAPSGIGLANAKLTPVSQSHRDLVKLPSPRGRITAAVYSFRDQTGQYKPEPNSSFSTAVTQGASTILLKALKDSQWFVPVERENLQNLLTERRIIRASDAQAAADPQAGRPPLPLRPLLPASIALEGGIVGYESNVKTGGAGARYLGIGAFTLYRTDQVTVNLRAVDVRSGEILTSVSTTKAIFSHEVDLNVFRFVRFRELLEIDAGYTRNEPAQLCVTDAIEAAVIHLIVQGVLENNWMLANEADINTPVFQYYATQANGG